MLTLRHILLHRLTQERATVFYAIEAMPEPEMVGKPAVGEWSVKDILGHLTSWEEEIRRGIEEFMRGEGPQVLDIVDVDAWNAEQVRRKSSLTLSQVQRDMLATRRRLLDLVTHLPDEAFERQGPPPMQQPLVPRLLDTIADHDRAHWTDLIAYKVRWIAAQQMAG